MNNIIWFCKDIKIYNLQLLLKFIVSFYLFFFNIIFKSQPDSKSWSFIPSIVRENIIYQPER